MPDSRDSALIHGRYAVRRELGRGGSAVVWVATDEKLGGLVAIKAMHEELNNSRFADRFRREIRLMADFGHANILPILDSGEWNGRLFYAMKYVEGSESVRDRLLRHPGGLPIEDVLEMARGVCGALNYAHARNILHRDVKPENILMSGRHPYLTDFGVAKALEPVYGDTLTSSGYALGTQRYMSPEQEVADPHLDGRTDVWSLSCVIFEALTGLHPFNSPDASRMRAMKVADKPESLRRHRPNVPAWLEAAVERGLKPNPADRWQSIEEFSRVLEQSGFFVAPQASDAEVRLRSRDDMEVQRTPAAGNSATPSSVSIQDSTTDATFGPRTRRYALMVALLIIGGGGVAAWASSRKENSLPDEAAAQHVIAVNIVAAPAAPALDEVTQNVSAAVTRELSAIPAFRVLSGTFMTECRQQSPTACLELLKEQSVDTRVNATMDRSGDSLRVVMEVVDERTKSTIASVTASVQTLDDATSVDRFASRLAVVFRQRLGAYRGQEAIVLPGADAASRALLSIIARERADADSLAAFPGANEQRIAFDALARADSVFIRLLERHQRRAALWIERGWVALDMGSRNADRQVEMIKRAIAYADSAMARGTDSARAHELRGHAKVALADAMPYGAQASLDMECDAERDLELAVAGDESLYRSWNAISWLRWSAGRTHEAKLAANHAMTRDAYFDKGRAGLVNTFFAQLLLGNFRAAREVCFGGHDLWPSDYKFIECQLTLMMYDTSVTQSGAVARQLVAAADRLDSQAKARVMGNEFRTLYREIAAAIVATRGGDAAFGRSVLDRVSAYVRESGSAALTDDFRPMESILRWELGDVATARSVLAQWLRNRPDQLPNFRQDPLWEHMQVRDAVLRQLDVPLVAAATCTQSPP